MELFTPGHLLVLAVAAAVLFFGWKQLPDMSRSLGRSLRIFRSEMKGGSGHGDAADSSEAASSTTRAAVSAAEARPAVTAADQPAAKALPAARPRPRPTPHPSSAQHSTGAGASGSTRSD